MALTHPRLVALALAAGLVTAPALALTAPHAMQLAQSDVLAQSDQPEQSDPTAPADAPAQSDQPAASDAPAPQAVVPDDAQIDSFVTATVRIIKIQREAQQEITAAEEPDAQKEVRDNALLMIVAAVEEEGLSVNEYNGIVEHVEGDPELGETVKQRIQEQITQ
jgi:hypothetical protein